MTNAAHKAHTPCEHCKETFKGTVGLATHMRKAHKLNPDGSHYVEPEKKYAEPKIKKNAIVVKVKRTYTKKDKEDYHHATPKQPIALYAYVTAHLEAAIHRVAFEHDLVEKHFAKGYFEYLLHSEVR